MFAAYITDTNPPCSSKRKTNILNKDTLKLCIKASVLFGITGVILREWAIWFTLISSAFGSMAVYIAIGLVNKAVSSKNRDIR